MAISMRLLSTYPIISKLQSPNFAQTKVSVPGLVACFYNTYVLHGQLHHQCCSFYVTKPSVLKNFKKMALSIRSSVEGSPFDPPSNNSNGRTRLIRIIRAIQTKLNARINELRKNLPLKILFFLVGFYSATAFATVIGQTGDWDVLSAALAVVVVEGIGALMYRASLPLLNKIKGLITMFNYWKAGLSMGLFLDSFKFEMDDIFGSEYRGWRFQFMDLKPQDKHGCHSKAFLRMLFNCHGAAIGKRALTQCSFYWLTLAFFFHFQLSFSSPLSSSAPSVIVKMSVLGRRGIHYFQKLNSANIPTALIEKGQNRVIEASLTLIRERAKLKGELVRALGGAVASASLLGVPLGHNSSFLQGPAFAPPRIREAIWCGSTNPTTEEGKELTDPRVLTDVGDVPVQEIRDCGVDDERLMKVVSESVKLVMEEDPLRPLVLGGDHSISYPVVRAVSEKLGGQVDILHLDAHPDNYDAYEGNYFSHASSFARIMEGGYARRLLQVGIRSISQEGRDQCKRFGVELYEMRTFSRDREYLENLKLGEGVKGVYISIDVDSLDPAFAPGVSHIEPGGLSFRDIMNIIHNLKGDIVGADVVEFNPQRDTVDGMTAMVAAKLVRELTAKIAK